MLKVDSSRQSIPFPPDEVNIDNSEKSYEKSGKKSIPKIGIQLDPSNPNVRWHLITLIEKEKE